MGAKYTESKTGSQKKKQGGSLQCRRRGDVMNWIYGTEGKTAETVGCRQKGDEGVKLQRGLEFPI